jgi:hypothetical protein
MYNRQYTKKHKLIDKKGSTRWNFNAYVTRQRPGQVYNVGFRVLAYGQNESFRGYQNTEHVNDPYTGLNSGQILASP